MKIRLSKAHNPVVTKEGFFCEKKVVGAIYSFIYGTSENVETYRSKCKSAV